MTSKTKKILSCMAMAFLLHSPLAQSDRNTQECQSIEADREWLTRVLYQANHEVRLHEETAEKLEPGYMQNRLINWAARGAAVIGAIAAAGATAAAWPAITPFAELPLYVQGHGWVLASTPGNSAFLGGLYATVPVALGSAMAAPRADSSELSPGRADAVKVTVAPPVVLKSEEIKTATGFEDLLESLYAYAAKSKDLFALEKSSGAAPPPTHAYKSAQLQKEIQTFRGAEKEVRGIAQRLSKKYESYSLFGGNQKNYWRVLMYESQALAEISKLKALWAEERLSFIQSDCLNPN
jgi:hypothetical protein